MIALESAKSEGGGDQIGMPPGFPRLYICWSVEARVWNEGE